MKVLKNSRFFILPYLTLKLSNFAFIIRIVELIILTLMHPIFWFTKLSLITVIRHNRSQTIRHVLISRASPSGAYAHVRVCSSGSFSRSGQWKAALRGKFEEWVAATRPSAKKMQRKWQSMKYGCDKCNKVFNRLLLADQEQEQPTSQLANRRTQPSQATTNYQLSPLSLTPKMNKTQRGGCEIT